MKPEDIQCAMKKKRVTQKDIANKLHISDMAVSRIIHRFGVSDRIMRAVAEAIDKDHRQVFPEYYLRPPRRKTSKVAAM